MLSMAESLVLLALDDEKGTVGWQNYDELDIGLAGALLADLALRGRIGVDGKRVRLLDSSQVIEPLLDEALTLVAGSSKERDPKGWVQETFHQVKHARDRTCAGLAEQGILRREEHTTLLIFRRARYPSSDREPEYALRAALQAAVAAPKPPESRLLVLLSLARACGVVDTLFAKAERKGARKRVAALVNGEPWGEAVAKAISARRAEFTAATTAATIH
jgi:Golgi phosphoprotein 3